VNSEQYRKCWVDRGFAPEKLKILPRGLDTDLFNPARRDPSFWRASGRNGEEIRLLYVGRISREKDLDVLAAAYEEVRKAGHPVKLFLVGARALIQRLWQLRYRRGFPRYLTGEALAQAYASADIFVFPSTTTRLVMWSLKLKHPDFR
jgi:glycosyltransferase involved in cell wall biosynthesis